jgi:Icc-related predicted phosphoesterase
MKILAITDIHQIYDAARAAWMIESPDLILDCGDHDQIMNLFGSTPHFYIRGNHEPRKISLIKDNDSLPTSIPNGDIIKFTHDEESITFSGIDGNYGAKQTIYQVNPLIVDHLKEHDPRTIDILLLHESPLNVNKNSRAYQFALQVIAEIDRLQPKLVLSGHTNIFSEYISSQKVKFVNFDDMCNGYLVIVVEGNHLTYERKRAFFGK